ncbi:hypothetical protein [Alicyclobacillus mengziensis]|uniref:Uncharacterized protein n=1 Tax=Alicyclobacillus mengziensis TaxID=2931921 RepID=A0A9X7Z8I4_9BACL|nr:hypothetical protein [Alicyclobacillus mengziensis]QSO48363.1 hypothetical protein JZ786_05080 [Alicyclobacillus mengziensis]
MNDDFVENSEHQPQEQVERATQVVQRLQAISVQIKAFERCHGGTFETLFGHQTDGMSQTADAIDWKDLVEERKRLIAELDRDDIPCGIYAVPRNPNAPRVKIRRLVDWCEESGIPLSEIHIRVSPEIMKQFLVYPNENEANSKREQGKKWE